MAGRAPGRNLHPGAWWLWAVALATAASRTTNPLLLALVVGVVWFVVDARRSEAPWARGFKAYVVLGLVVIAIRVVFRILLGGDSGDHVLLRLPEVPLPEAAAGIQIGGPVTAEAVLSSAYDGLRLATLLLCVGAANVLANPKRLLKAVPAALHEVGVAVTVALSVAPSSSRAASGSAAPAACGARAPGAGTSSARWRSRCSPTPSTGPSSSPRPWTPAATDARPPCRPGPDGSPPASCSEGSWPCASARTASSTAPLPATSASRCSSAGRPPPGRGWC